MPSMSAKLDQAGHVGCLSRIYSREDGGVYVTYAKSAARVVRLDVKVADDSTHVAVDVPEMATVVGADPWSDDLQAVDDGRPSPSSTFAKYFRGVKGRARGKMG